MSHNNQSATITIPRPTRRLLAALREAVAKAKLDPHHPERQEQELVDLAIAVKGDQLQLTCTFGLPPTPHKE